MQNSLFSKSIYRTWLRRYWVGGALMILVFLVTSLAFGSSLRWMTTNGAYYRREEYAYFISESGASFLFALFICAAAIVAGMLCIHYLQEGKAAVMIHSLPISRQSLLLSVVLAGLTLLIVPILAAGIFFSVIMDMNHIFTILPVMHFILVMVSIALLFFSISTFVGMFTGKSIAQGLITILFVNIPIIIEAIIVSFSSRFLFGYYSSEPATIAINPFFQYASYLEAVSGDYAAGNKVSVTTPLVMILISLVFFALTWVLYRIRRTESAGDVIAMAAVKPIFRYMMALLGAFGLGGLFRSFLGLGNTLVIELIISVVGGLLGYFIAEMFIRRTVRVFKYYKGGLVFSAILIVFMVGFQFDWMGYGRYTLPEDKVVAISFSEGYYDDNRVLAAMKNEGLHQYIDLSDLDLKDVDGYLEKQKKGDTSPMPKEIADQILETDSLVFTGDLVAKGVEFQHLLADNAKILHKNEADNDYYGYSNYYTITMHAKLEDGRVVSRNYSFNLNEDIAGENAVLYKQVEDGWNDIKYEQSLSEARNIVKQSQIARGVILNYRFKEYMDGEYNTYYTLNRGEWDGLFEAYLKDMEEAKGKENVLEVGYDNVFIEINLYLGNRDVYAEIGTNHKHTIEWLLENDLLTKREIKEFEKWIVVYDQEVVPNEYGYYE